VAVVSMHTHRANKFSRRGSRLTQPLLGHCHEWGDVWFFSQYFNST